jgi:hypothetical protein
MCLKHEIEMETSKMIHRWWEGDEKVENRNNLHYSYSLLSPSKVQSPPPG